ncbi:MAG: aldose epimerase family protein [Cyclobacteriaceae bacterium]
MSSHTSSDPTLCKPRIEKAYWGNVDGKIIWLYKLSMPNGLQMTVTNYGGIVQSLFVPTANGKCVDVVLGYDSLHEYIQDPFCMGAVVGRFANRIESGRVNIDGQWYKLTVTTDGFHQHGGTNGFHKKVWDAETFSEAGAVGIVLEYTSPHLEEGFPGNLSVKVVYTLFDANKWSVDFFAETDQATLINLTQHSYFNLGGHASGTISNHLLQTYSPWYLPATQRQIPTGKIDSVKETPFDFLIENRIGEEMDSQHPQLIVSKGYDHFFVLEKEHSLVLKPTCILTEPVSGMQMKVSTTEPGFHFYSGNFLSEIFLGKELKEYHTRSGLCIETHHFPDAPNHSHFPSTLLEPGKIFKSKTEFCFS